MEWFKRCIEILTLLVIAAGLYFAWDQAKKITESIQLNNRAVNLTTWANVSNQTIEIDKVFIQHPEFHQYFYDKVDISTNHKDYQRARAIALLMLDFVESSLTIGEYLSENLPETIVEIEPWTNWARDLFQSSPLLCRLYKENKSSYGSTLRRHADLACKVT